MKPKNAFWSMKPSDQMKTVIEFLEEVPKAYAWSYEQVGEMDKATQDILHSFELDKMTASERSKLTTALIKTRKERRRHKDIVETLEPLILFLESNIDTKLLHQFKETLGKVRKVEQYHQNRTYRKKISKEGTN